MRVTLLNVAPHPPVPETGATVRKTVEVTFSSFTTRGAKNFAISTIRVPGGDGTSRSVEQEGELVRFKRRNTAGQLTGSSSSTLAIQIGVEVQHWRIVPSNHHALQREFLWRQWVFEIKAHVRIPLLDGGTTQAVEKSKVGRITAIKLDVEAAAVDAHGRSAQRLSHTPS